MTDLKKGDQLFVHGYDLVAMATAFVGGGAPDTQECVVLNNNSTHYLVAHRDPSTDYAVFIRSYRYNGNDDGEDSYFQAYDYALQAMVDFVKAH